MMKQVYAAMFAIASVVTLSACSTSPVGMSFNSVPPRLVDLDPPKQGKPVDSRAIVNGQVQRVGWDRPSAFGPVPDNMQAKGKSVCQSIKYNKPIGYHPRAMDYAGNPIPDGGFYCGN